MTLSQDTLEKALGQTLSWNALVRHIGKHCSQRPTFVEARRENQEPKAVLELPQTVQHDMKTIQFGAYFGSGKHIINAKVGPD